ncbi:hypothetical protein L6164_002383 [Bauhinia variegata]|uniref:Uncharacterized protein n=1 Tax=Bauhinia variegata TaxID=167791 RepID=A0ACB9Q072_BAUVA|nr:hypothetical protein L6164_002383 [Bauhinia variegata]
MKVPRPLIFCFFLLLPLLLLLLLLVAPTSSSSSSEKVTVSLYYEALCPYCADFIVNHLVKIFQTGLISSVDLRMVPWGNAWIRTDGTVVCQHGDDECFLNTIEACTIALYPDVAQHFRFIDCIEQLTLESRHNEWANCFQIAGLGKGPVDCYSNGNGKSIEKKFAMETDKLNPPHRFVPWVVVNNQPLQEDYLNFVDYICRAFNEDAKPGACTSVSARSTYDFSEKNNSLPNVCYVGEARNLSLPLVTKLRNKSP